MSQEIADIMEEHEVDEKQAISIYADMQDNAYDDYRNECIESANQY